MSEVRQNPSLPRQRSRFTILELQPLRDLPGLLVELPRPLQLSPQGGYVPVAESRTHFQLGLVVEESLLFFHGGHIALHVGDIGEVVVEINECRIPLQPCLQNGLRLVQTV